MTRTPTGARDRGDRSRGDRGLVVVFFAFSVTAMLVVAALVLGSSLGYTAVRNAQNAVDAAAMAATGELRAVQAAETPPADAGRRIHDTAVSVAEANGATQGTVTCELVTAGYALTQSDDDVIGPCADGVPSGTQTEGGTEFVTVVPAGARVTASDTRVVPFNAFVDQETVTANAVAAATMQPVRGGWMRAPFLVCATAAANANRLLLPDPTGEPPYVVNPAALGEEILVHSQGNEMNKDGRNCGEQSWYGLADTARDFLVPPPTQADWWDVKSGSTIGQVKPALGGPGACTSSFEVGCRVPLPLCVGGVGNGTNFTLECVRMATFEITFNGTGAAQCGATDNKKAICAAMVEGGIGLDGQGTADVAAPWEIVRIRLVQ